MTSQPQGEKPERYGIWKCPLCFWQGLELKESEVLSYHDRFHSKQGSHCVCLDFDLVVEMDQPATPSADEESATPRTDAEEYVWKSTASHRQRKMVPPEFARTLERELASLQSERDILRDEIDKLRAALAERDRERGTLNPAK